MTHPTQWLTAATVSFLTLLATGTAHAQSTGYGAAQGVSTGGDPGSGGDAAGQLPFTGLDMTPVLIIGVVLLLAGLALARASRRHPSS